MAANIKLGVDMTAFKQGINEAKAQIKAFDAQLKVAETTFKKTGDAEAAMSTKTDALTNKLKTQKQMVRQYEEALSKMRDNEVDPMSESYKQLEAAMLNMQSAANETEVKLRDLSATQLTAASSADKLNDSVSSIGKKMSLSQVITGIDKITSGLENATKRAVSLGEELFNNVMSRAQWADDTATMAMMYGIDLDTFLRMQKLVTNGLDTSVEAILGAQSKLKRGIGSDAKTISAALNEMGISMTTFAGGGKYGPIEQAKDSLELFWEVGQKLMTWGDEYQKEDMAQKLFGKGWKELVPLFSEYKSLEEYSAALQNVNVNSTEDVNALADLNDKISELKGNLDTLSTDILARLAPALSQGADALNGMLTKLMEYLETPDGQAMLERLGTAVSGLFEDLGKIDPQDVISGFTGVFEKIIQGFEWLVNNKEPIIHALEAVVYGWAGLKLTGGALQILQLINGVKSFQGVPTETPQNVTGGNGDVIATGGGSGTGATGGFWSNLLNKATLAAMAKTFGDAFDPQKSETWQKFLQDTAGQSAAEKNRYALEHDFGPGVYELLNGEEVPVEVTPAVQENAASDISDQIGVVPVAIKLIAPNVEPADGGSAGGGGNNVAMTKANGIWSVPYDGYLARLHKYERVMPAREVSSRNFSSNLYVESMIMNNGADAAGLAASMAAAQRRTMTGFGS